MKPFAKLPFTNDLISALPGDPEPENFTRKVEKIIYSEVVPTPVSAPKLVGWSESLAEELGISKPGDSDQDSVEMLGGNLVHDEMRPYASRYGGHQFGNWAGQLGDGRAITLGEAFTDAGKREFQLKGAGPTPYSRRADGRAVFRSSLREFICSEAMHFLGVPTTRALSLVLTGDPVTRDFFYDGNPKDEPGAIVCRVSPSFLRFGNFEILASQGEYDVLKALVDHTIQEHYPDLNYSGFLNEVARRTAVMTAHWMRVGFVHGVMNTDNMSILGLTIDYGPYGWLEPFEPTWTPNTTDAATKRYAFGNQPGISLWNLARFAEAMGPLIQDHTKLEKCLEIYRDTFGKTHTQFISEKLGFKAPKSGDAEGVAELFSILQESQADYTLFFRALSNWDAKSDLLQLLEPTLYLESVPSPLAAKIQSWASWYGSRLADDRVPVDERQAKMKRVNPKYVLRNYLAQNAIKKAEAGVYSDIERLMKVLEKPFDEQPEHEDLAQKRPEWAKNSPGSSTLSCSS